MQYLEKFICVRRIVPAHSKQAFHNWKINDRGRKKSIRSKKLWLVRMKHEMYSVKRLLGCTKKKGRLITGNHLEYLEN